MQLEVFTTTKLQTDKAERNWAAVVFLETEKLNWQEDVTVVSATPNSDSWHKRNVTKITRDRVPLSSSVYARTLFPI